VDGERLIVLKEGQDGNMRIGVKFPCVVTFTKPSFEPRYPTIKRKLAASRAEIPVLSDEDFPEIDKTRIGLKGSPTNVKRSFVPQRKKGGVIFRDDSVKDSALKLTAALSEAHVI
jgi:electron transfer flavoprotein beta subunit